MDGALGERPAAAAVRDEPRPNPLAYTESVLAGQTEKRAPTR